MTQMNYLVRSYVYDRYMAQRKLKAKGKRLICLKLTKHAVIIATRRRA